MSNLKYKRQVFEHNRQLGQKLIQNKFIKFSNLLETNTKNNKLFLNKQFLSEIKPIKTLYNIRNISKCERTWEQLFNKYIKKNYK